MKLFVRRKNQPRSSDNVLDLTRTDAHPSIWIFTDYQHNETAIRIEFDNRLSVVKIFLDNVASGLVEVVSSVG